MELIEIAVTRNQLKLLTALAVHERPLDAYEKFKDQHTSPYASASFKSDEDESDDEIRKVLSTTCTLLQDVCNQQPLHNVMVKKYDFQEWIMDAPFSTFEDIEHHTDWDGVLKESVGKEIPVSMIEGAFDSKLLSGEMIEIEANFKLTSE
jgi:hypothetical protein